MKPDSTTGKISEGEECAHTRRSEVAIEEVAEHRRCRRGRTEKRPSEFGIEDHDDVRVGDEHGSTRGRTARDQGLQRGATERASKRIESGGGRRE
jgi:hypothetical protein